MQQELSYGPEVSSSVFIPGKSRLDIEIFSEEGELLEYIRDSHDYTSGKGQGQIEIDPDEVAKGYDRRVQVVYTGYSPFFLGEPLQIVEISDDRKQIKLYSSNITNTTFITQIAEVKKLVGTKQADLAVEVGDFRTSLVNIIADVTGSKTVAVVALGDFLPSTKTVEDTALVLDYLGSADFEVEPSYGETAPAQYGGDAIVLRSPNFDVLVDSKSTSTDYLNSLELLKLSKDSLKKGPYSTFREAAQHVSVNYEDFSDFIHFSSAVERLENARYKFEKIFECQNQIQNLPYRDPRISELERQVEGIIDSFDHYENYLWYESSSVAWPKRSSNRPYKNDDRPSIYEPWYDDLLAKAEAYDNANKDILVSTIPAAIREDEEHNEPYVVFIHMIGQHFDDVWLCAKGLSDRYKADNRLNFGISKEFVKDAIKAFGIQLYESNQNLTGLFELCNADGTYEGEEITIPARHGDFKRIAENVNSSEQPILDGNYTKEVYKRIYHNVPILLKAKGTSRGLKVLLNCFGIPNDILTFKVQGGVDYTERPFFGPEDGVDIYDQKIENSEYLEPGNSKKIRIQDTAHPTETSIQGDQTLFYTQSILSRFTSVTESTSKTTDDSHRVEVGFDLNEAFNKYVKTNITGSFSIDDIIGDPRNTEDQYGSNVWKALQTDLLADLAVNEKFRAPAAIIRLVRYIDLTFFRMLKDFVPARASIDSGVIVKDNILHRNRYRGAQCETTVNEHPSDTIDTGFITGSHGGSIVGDVGITASIISTGDRYVPKIVTSGSLKYTGELSGSEFQVDHLDITRFNDYRKLILDTQSFTYSTNYLDLPDVAVASTLLGFTNYCAIYNIEPKIVNLVSSSNRDYRLISVELAVSGNRGYNPYFSARLPDGCDYDHHRSKPLQVWTKKTDNDIELAAELSLNEYSVNPDDRPHAQDYFLGWFLTTTGSSKIYPGISLQSTIPYPGASPVNIPEGSLGTNEKKLKVWWDSTNSISYPKDNSDIAVYRPAFYSWYSSNNIEERYRCPREIVVTLISVLRPDDWDLRTADQRFDVLLSWKARKVTAIDETGSKVTGSNICSVLGPVDVTLTTYTASRQRSSRHRPVYHEVEIPDYLFFGKESGSVCINSDNFTVFNASCSLGISERVELTQTSSLFIDDYKGPFEYSGSIWNIVAATKEELETWGPVKGYTKVSTSEVTYKLKECTYTYDPVDRTWSVITGSTFHGSGIWGEVID